MCARAPGLARACVLRIIVPIFSHLSRPDSAARPAPRRRRRRSDSDGLAAADLRHSSHSCPPRSVLHATGDAARSRTVELPNSTRSACRTLRNQGDNPSLARCEFIVLTVLTYLLTDEAAPSARDDNLTSTAFPLAPKPSRSSGPAPKRACLSEPEQASKQRA